MSTSFPCDLKMHRSSPSLLLKFVKVALLLKSEFKKQPIYGRCPVSSLDVSSETAHLHTFFLSCDSHSHEKKTTKLHTERKLRAVSLVGYATFVFRYVRLINLNCSFFSVQVICKNRNN